MEKIERHRAACQMVLTKLPRELRNAIYSQIVPGPSVSVHHNPKTDHGKPDMSIHFRQTNCLSNNAARKPSSMYTWPYRPDEVLLSQEFSEELCAYFYRHIRFDSDTGFARFVMASLSTAAMRYPIKHMSVWVNSYVRWRRDGSYFGPPPDPIRTWEVRFQMLDKLASIPAENVHLTILLRAISRACWDSIQTAEGNLRTNLEGLIPRLVRLQKVGYVTKVVLQPGLGKSKILPETMTFLVDKEWELTFTPETTEFSI